MSSGHLTDSSGKGTLLILHIPWYIGGLLLQNYIFLQHHFSRCSKWNMYSSLEQRAGNCLPSFPYLRRLEAIPIYGNVPVGGRRSGYPDQWLSQSSGSTRGLHQFTLSLVQCTPTSFYFLQLVFAQMSTFHSGHQMHRLTVCVTTSCWSWNKWSHYCLAFWTYPLTVVNILNCMHLSEQF